VARRSGSTPIRHSRSSAAGGPIEEQREVYWEVWYYNFGSSMFMQRLSFRDGQLQNIEALEYGVDEIGTTCPPPIASRGLTSGELVARCGEPTTRQRNEGAFVRRVPGALSRPKIAVKSGCTMMAPHI
jgi:hypothetical protein